MIHHLHYLVSILITALNCTYTYVRFTREKMTYKLKLKGKFNQV